MRAVKLCTNKILQFLTQVGQYNGRKKVVVVVVHDNDNNIKPRRTKESRLSNAYQALGGREAVAGDRCSSMARTLGAANSGAGAVDGLARASKSRTRSEDEAIQPAVESRTAASNVSSWFTVDEPVTAASTKLSGGRLCRRRAKYCTWTPGGE